MHTRLALPSNAYSVSSLFFLICCKTGSIKFSRYRPSTDASVQLELTGQAGRYDPPASKHRPAVISPPFLRCRACPVARLVGIAPNLLNNSLVSQLIRSNMIQRCNELVGLISPVESELMMTMECTLEIKTLRSVQRKVSFYV